MQRNPFLLPAFRSIKDKIKMDFGILFKGYPIEVKCGDCGQLCHKKPPGLIITPTQAGQPAMF
jgi:hypothetical protein